MSCETFARDMLKIVVAQLCKHQANTSQHQANTSRGEFTSISRSAFETFTDVLHRFIVEAGYIAHLKCELASRTECNIYDVQHALAKLSSRGEFKATFSEMMRFLSSTEEIPFAKVMPRFPIEKQARPVDVPFARDPECMEELPPHAPDFAPPFPSKYTYRSTPIYAGLTDERLIRKKRNKHKRQVESSLIRLRAQKGGDLPGRFGDVSAPSGESVAAANAGAASSAAHQPSTKEEHKNPYLRSATRVSQVLTSQDLHGNGGGGTVPGAPDPAIAAWPPDEPPTFKGDRDKVPRAVVPSLTQKDPDRERERKRIRAVTIINAPADEGTGDGAAEEAGNAEGAA